MATPWTPPPRHVPVERPWLGVGLLVAIPLLSLILIRMLWSGSSLWFLTVGIILLGAAAIVFLARKPQDIEHDRQMPVTESRRTPLILGALGIVFLAMLLLPNLSGGSSDVPAVTGQPQQPVSEVSASTVNAAPTAQLPAAQVEEPVAAVEEPVDTQSTLTDDGTYVVASGDTLWAIAETFGVTVDAIIDANELDNASELQIGQELVIPAADEEPEE